ncbi:MAG: GIY-YIG nuclease family protein [Gammaproteobacteria bacterium]|nr:GIY-YIG nuclease family protein [Gammaproteobacteria bacterium]
MNNWFVYIVRCSNDSLYTGITTDIERRMKQHNAGKGAAYTRSHRPVELVYQEDVTSRSEASIRESELKKLTKQEKELLVNQL